MIRDLRQNIDDLDHAAYLFRLIKSDDKRIKTYLYIISKLVLDTRVIVAEELQKKVMKSLTGDQAEDANETPPS